MARPANKYTNPETGETLTTKGWCRKLKISDSQLVRRLAQHGETSKAFEPKAMRLVARADWEEWERDFLRECAGDSAWTLKEIAKKLERTIDSVHEEMKDLGISNKAGRRPSHNWMYIWKMKKEGLSMSAISRVLNTNLPTVRHALRKMDKMDDAEMRQFFSNCGYI